MRTILTTNDVKNILQNIFKENDEKIILVNEDDEQEEVNIVDYLNVKFYSWKERVVSDNGGLTNFEQWLDSMNVSLKQSYCLVEQTGAEVTPSQDIDSATITANCSFLISSDKANNLDYYTLKIRNSLLGNAQSIQNAYGDILKAYINIGILTYESEPVMTQVGECIVATLKLKITYLTEALDYEDTPVYLSLDNGVTYNQIPYIKGTWQNIFVGNSVPTQALPNRTGLINTSVSQIKTISFYDFNKPLTNAFNEMFWKLCCYSYQGATDLTPIVVNSQEVNIPVYVKVISNGITYIYIDVIKNMQKDTTNGDFNISSITLQNFGRR